MLIRSGLPQSFKMKFLILCLVLFSSSGSQTFSDRVPFVVPALSGNTHHLVPETSQCAKYYSIKTLKNQNGHKRNKKKMAVRKYGHF